VRILIVEDEAKVARALTEGFESEHYQVVVAKTGEDGCFLVSAGTFDLIVLDLMLPGRAGLEILGACRRRGLQTPVLILTAGDAVDDRVLGLDGGADDYRTPRRHLPAVLSHRPGTFARCGGAGLRLCIARWAVELHGGHIELSDEGRAE
jgi:DNA-binding response OmpR family regulator